MSLGIRRGQTVFAMLVIMTLVSTVMTAPALSAIGRFRRAEPQFVNKSERLP